MFKFSRVEKKNSFPLTAKQKEKAIVCSERSGGRSSLLLHRPLNDEAYNLGLRIGAYCHRLLEVTGELVLAVVRYIDNAALTGFDGFLGKLGHGAATAGKGLVNDKWSRTGIGESKATLHNGFLLAELAEVVAQGIKLYLGKLVGF